MPGFHEARARRRALRRITPNQEPCGVPGCDGGKVTEDCCYRHSLTWHGPRNALANDGIIDWVAIDVAASGLRSVRLTWVEKDIAAGVMHARGEGPFEMQRRLGVRVSGVPDSPRRLEAERIAKAGVLERLDRELRYADAC